MLNPISLPITDLLDHSPDSALLIADHKIVYCNSSSQCLFPKLSVGDPTPDCLVHALGDVTPPTSIQCALLGGEYRITLQTTQSGLLVVLRLSPAMTPELKLSRVAQTLRQDTSSLSAVLQQLPNQISKPEYLSVANQSVYRLQRLADHLSFISRPDQELFHPTTIDLASFCLDIADQMDGVCQSGNWNFEYKSDCSNLLMSGDTILLQRLVFALISNSMKALPTGGNFGLTLSHTKTHAMLTLWDSGTGQVNLAQLFGNPASHPPSLDPYEGVGLGLTTARRIVSLHNGSLILENPPQGGLKCAISLPLQTSSTHYCVETPSTDSYGGQSPLLIELADVLPYQFYQTKEIEY